ncbi:MAG: homoserine kinase, partial [Gammaproteobacteria bacterium]
MIAIKDNIRSVTAFAPASCGNIAVGFDVLGFALATPGDEVTLTRRDDQQLSISHIDSATPLPEAVDKNTATVAIQALLRDLELTLGFDVQIKKGIASGSGMGSSAASAVAAVVACNGFLQSPLSPQQLIQYALQGEAIASGSIHADNVAPSLLGGLVLTYSLDPIAWLQLPASNFYWTVVHPDLEIQTKAARGILPPSISLQQHSQQSA